MTLVIGNAGQLLTQLRQCLPACCVGDLILRLALMVIPKRTPHCLVRTLLRLPGEGDLLYSLEPYLLVLSFGPSSELWYFNNDLHAVKWKMV